MYQEDEKWVEAKRTLRTDDWIEVTSFYRELGGHDVFVYALLDREKKLILDIDDDDNVLLYTKDGVVSEDYERVFTSRKYFSYTTTPVKTNDTYIVAGEEMPIYKEY